MKVLTAVLVPPCAYLMASSSSDGDFPARSFFPSLVGTANPTKPWHSMQNLPCNVLCRQYLRRTTTALPPTEERPATVSQWGVLISERSPYLTISLGSGMTTGPEMTVPWESTTSPLASRRSHESPVM